MIGALLALYPAHWRRRYGEEFRAVLESRPLGPFDVADVLLGALDARLSPRGLIRSATTDGGLVVMLRIGGLGAVIGGCLWFLSLGANLLLGGEHIAWVVLAALATFGLLLAFTGLSAFQAHRHPVLAWGAFLIPGLGSIASVIGLAGMALIDGEDPLLMGLSVWSIWIVGLLGTLVGSIIFAIATIRATVFSRRASILLAVSSAAVLVLAFGTSGVDTTTPLGRLVFAVALGSFALSWIILGTAALRRGPIRAVAPA